MITPEVEKLRDLIAARIHAADCDCADFVTCELDMAGTYRAIADSVLELFPEVELAHEHRSPGLILPLAPHQPGQARATHALYVLRTAPEPIEVRP